MNAKSTAAANAANAAATAAGASGRTRASERSGSQRRDLKKAGGTPSAYRREHSEIAPLPFFSVVNDGTVFETTFEREQREANEKRRKWAGGPQRGFRPASDKASQVPLRKAGGVAAEGSYHGHPDHLVARAEDKSKFMRPGGWRPGGDRQKVGATGVLAS